MFHTDCYSYFCVSCEDSVFSDVTSSTVMHVYRRFERTHFHHLLEDAGNALLSTSVNFYQTIRRHVPEDITLHSLRVGNLAINDIYRLVFVMGSLCVCLLRWELNFQILFRSVTSCRVAECNVTVHECPLGTMAGAWLAWVRGQHTEALVSADWLLEWLMHRRMGRGL